MTRDEFLLNLRMALKDTLNQEETEENVRYYSDYIKEQEELRDRLNDETCIKIINNRIISTTEMVENKNIIENEFYIMVYDSNKENIEKELNKRANAWVNRLKNCELKSEVLEETEIILLVKSFTIPEFARTEGTDYGDNIVQIKKKGA